MLHWSYKEEWVSCTINAYPVLYTAHGRAKINTRECLRHAGGGAEKAKTNVCFAFFKLHLSPGYHPPKSTSPSFHCYYNLVFSRKRLTNALSRRRNFAYLTSNSINLVEKLNTCTYRLLCHTRLNCLKPLSLLQFLITGVPNIGFNLSEKKLYRYYMRYVWLRKLTRAFFDALLTVESRRDEPWL